MKGTGMSKKSFPLIDATEPNLIEETFDYSLPPLIRFDEPVVEYIDGEPVESRALGGPGSADPRGCRSRERQARGNA